METANHLDQSYSREQQGLGPDHEAIASPVALVRSFTSKSRSSSSRSRQSSRNRSFLAGVESSRAARLRELQKNVEDYDDDRAEKNVDSIEKVVSRTPSSTLTSRNGSHAPSEASSVHVGGGEQAPGRRVIRFEEGDPENPNNWGQWKKAYSLFVAIMSVMNSTINSSIIGGAVGPISRHFNEYNEYVLILPTSMYLIGYACGPMVWGPLSETHGRKGTMIWSFAILTIFCIASAVAPNFAALVVFRFLVGVGGSCAISVVGGVCADVYQNPKSRGRAMSTFMAATTFGPILGPPVSGFIAVVDWSWAFWVGAIFAGATWPLFFFFQETYGPAILKRRAERLRKETGDENIVAPIELEKRDLNHILTVVLTRPLRMVIFEPLVLFTCLYLSYAYSIFYIFLQSFPIIFEGIYGFNPGEMGLVFLAIGVGSIFSSAIYLYWDYYLERAQRLGRPWSQSEEMRRLPLACIAGPFFVISAFWLGWSAEKHVHWSVPVLAVVPFGFGYLCIFMALLNYLVDAYDIFAASAMAAASLSRSTFGAALPFAAKPMYRTMGVGWATSLLGFFSLALCIVPFVFVKWGDKMRSKSKFCQYLKQKKREEEEEREREARLEQSQVKGKEDV